MAKGGKPGGGKDGGKRPPAPHPGKTGGPAAPRPGAGPARATIPRGRLRLGRQGPGGRRG